MRVTCRSGYRLLLRSIFSFSLLLLALPVTAKVGQMTCDRLTATGNSEYPPYLWRKDKESEELLGANRLIMDEISRRIGVPIDLKHTGPWARAQREVKTGRIDLMAGAFFTIPRVKWMDYVHPAFLDTTSTVWIKKGSHFKYQDKLDLIGKRGLTVINNSFGEQFDRFAKSQLSINTVAGLEQAFQVLNRDGRVDYVLYEKHPGMAYAQLLGMDNKVEPLYPPISSEGLFLTVSHKSPCNTGALRGALAVTINEMLAEGFMEKAMKLALRDWAEFNNN